MAHQRRSRPYLTRGPDHFRSPSWGRHARTWSSTGWIDRGPSRGLASGDCGCLLLARLLGSGSVPSDRAHPGAVVAGRSARWGSVGAVGSRDRAVRAAAGLSDRSGHGGVASAGADDTDAGRSAGCPTRSQRRIDRGHAEFRSGTGSEGQRLAAAASRAGYAPPRFCRPARSPARIP